MMTEFYKIIKYYVCVIVLAYALIATDALKLSHSSIGALNFTRHRRQSEQTESTGCILPPYPEHGTWKLLKGEAKPGDVVDKPGGIVPEDSVIRYQCTSGYQLNVENPHRVCAENWSPMRVPECERRCPPLYSSTTYELACSDKRGKKIDCSAGTDGTYVEYTCAPFYETPFGYKRTLLCADGKWNQRPRCDPICGKQIGAEAKKMIYGVKPNEKLENPWVTALYQKINGSYQYICGGSILSPTIVLTAAHCVTNDSAVALPEEDYSVGVGKLYSQYKAPEDTQAQYLEIAKIIVHNDYKASDRRFLADLALLAIKGEITLTEVVQPVCFSNLKTIHLHPGNRGEVSAWGQTENELPSVKLRTLRLPYKYEVTCADELPANFSIKFNIIDKICAGLVNQSTSVCDGDSGSGLAFENPEDGRFYIHGLVSIGPFEGDHCNIQQNSLYTKVSFYYEYIERWLTLYAPEIRDCKLPPHPKNGKWTIAGQKKQPGDAVSSSTVLEIKCNGGFKLSSSTSTINCGSAHEMPICQLTCPGLSFPNGTDYRCTNKNKQVIDCSEAVDDSEVWYACPKGYRIPQGRINTAICNKGSWGSNHPECNRPVEDCGIKGNVSDEADGLEYPWNVILYEKEYHKNSTLEYVYLCGATLLSHRVIVTGALCVTDADGNILGKDKYLVGVGKVFENYKDPREMHTQYAEVSEVVPHQSYRGYNKHYLGDIALVVVKIPFTFNAFVRPACFYDINTIKLHSRDLGTIWKYNDKGDPVVFEIPFQDHQTCEREFPRYFSDKFLLADKICVGFHNKTPTLCRGGTGRGFVVKNPEDDRYYVHGLASVGPYNKGPDSSVCHHYKLYSSISFYYDFIENVLSKYL